MNNKLTLGSLFDGSGGFPLGAVLTGIEPLWASEIEPFPIRVTTKRLPGMKHLGDINRMDGSIVPPADIVTGGFCCQDLSVAGRRAGLHGERSGLFFQVIRIIREMLAVTDNEYPKFAVLENVPGMYSSNGGLDFQEVLNELIHIKDETLSVPLPEKGRWSTSGEIVGKGFSVGWRTLDAQFWGVAQRRRRCYIVVDFTGKRAGKILFDESGLRGHPTQSGCPWQAAAGSAETGAGNAVVFEPGACSRLGGRAWAIENHPVDSRVKFCENGIVQTLSERMGTGGGNIPLVMNEKKETPPNPAAFMGGQGSDAGSIAYSETVTPTLRGQAGGNSVPMVMTAFGIGSHGSSAMLSPNPHSGFYEAGTSRTLDLNCARPDCHQGGVAVVSYGIDRAAFNQGKGAQYKPQFTEESAATLTSRGPSAVCSRYIVRRLTPTECARLQGFPDWWCSGLGTEHPTEEEIAFWRGNRLLVGSVGNASSRNGRALQSKKPEPDSQMAPAPSYGFR